jgi:hypothetical protein
VSALLRFLETEYAPAHGPWYNGAVWGNVFVIPVAFLLGAVLWPPLRRRIHRFADRKLGAVHERLEESERALEHLIRHLPDVPPLPERQAGRLVTAPPARPSG